MGIKLGERLIEAGLVTPEGIEQALHHQKVTGHRLGDCLLDIGLVPEAPLLRFLAAELGTRFVSAEKLAKAKIPSDILDRIPVRLAERQNVLPLAYDAERKVLSLVMSEPQNEELKKELAQISGAGEVFAYVGMRMAIRAAIKKHYYGDPTAFAELEKGPDASGESAEPQAAQEGSGLSSMHASSLVREDGSRMGPARTSAGIAATLLRKNPGAARIGLGPTESIDIVGVVVGLLEKRRAEWEGHSSLVARYASRVAQRLGLSPIDQQDIALAAHLHDLGKPNDKHYTLSNNQALPPWKAEAGPAAQAPIDLLGSVQLPEGAKEILTQIHEAFDGSGVPTGLRGDQIASGARILATIDSFLDRLRNPHNASRRLHSKSEALLHLREQSGKLFDPRIVEALEGILSGDLLSRRLLSDGRQILIVEPDPQLRGRLHEALVQRSLNTHSVGSLEGGAQAALRGEGDLLVLSLSLGVADLLAVVQHLRGEVETAAVPILVLGHPSEEALPQKLLQAGVTAFIPLPLDPPAAASIVQEHLTERVSMGAPGRPVTGGFDELAPKSLLQTLGSQQKSGKIEIRLPSEQGTLQLEMGKVIFARFGTRLGTEAMAAVQALSAGEFTYDPNAVCVDPPNL